MIWTHAGQTSHLSISFPGATTQTAPLDTFIRPLTLFAGNVGQAIRPWTKGPFDPAVAVGGVCTAHGSDGEGDSGCLRPVSAHLPDASPRQAQTRQTFVPQSRQHAHATHRKGGETRRTRFLSSALRPQRCLSRRRNGPDGSYARNIDSTSRADRSVPLPPHTAAGSLRRASDNASSDRRLLRGLQTSSRRSPA